VHAPAVPTAHAPGYAPDHEPSYTPDHEPDYVPGPPVDTPINAPVKTPGSTDAQGSTHSIGHGESVARGDRDSELPSSTTKLSGTTPTPASTATQPRRTSRPPKPNPKYTNFDQWGLTRTQHFTNIAQVQIDTPASYAHALQSAHVTDWKQVMYNKIKSIKKNGTYILIPQPHSHNMIKTKWLYKVKLKADGSIDQLKARWVAKGFSQHYRIDYKEIFALVVWTKSLRYYLAIANTLSLIVHQMDMKTAFLHATLKEEIYTEQPEGFIDKEHPDHVCRLLKSLYGLKQVPFIWNCKINEHLHAIGYQTMDRDPCIYIKVINEQITIITLYINNCTLLTHSKLMDATKDDL
jgi:hypothetical protein